MISPETTSIHIWGANAHSPRCGRNLSTQLIDRIVYATATIISVLIIYDRRQNLRLVDVIGVIVGPVVAMFIAHVFAASR